MTETAHNADWVAILGAVSGVLALIITLLNILINYMTEPRLVFSAPAYARDWKFQNNITWRFVNMEVRSKGGLALECEARVIVLNKPNSVNLFKEIMEEGYGIHWADIPFSGQSTGALRVDIGETPHRLDIVFATPSMSGYSCLAMPIALNYSWNNLQAPQQAVLPQGEYKMKVVLSCKNGRGAKKVIKIASPNSWQDLNVEEVN